MDHFQAEQSGKNQQRLKFVPEQGKINPWIGGKKGDVKPEAAAEVESQAVEEEFNNSEAEIF